LHPIPGWSYSLRELIAGLLRQGSRVLAPDLIGFGKSDKPKREEVHSLEFHCQYLYEWLQRIDLKNVTLLVSQSEHPLVQPLMALAHGYIQSLQVRSFVVDPTSAAELSALKAPYPDTGHRAGERAFLSSRMNQMGKKL
jgi:tRNA(adenine34) deaminase